MFDFELLKIKRSVNQQFKFLFDLGFRFYSAQHQKEHMGYWEVILKLNDFLIKIYDDRGTVMILIGPEWSKDDEWYGLGTLVYFITMGKHFIGNYNGELRDRDRQMQRLSVILRKYINEIREVIGSNFKSSREQLRLAHQQFLDMSMEEYRKSRPETDFLKYVPKRKDSS